MIAVLSDVHANLEALRAVFTDMKTRNVQRIFFLGDIIGYGPNPGEVLEFMKHFEFCLMGNHDRAVLTGPPRNFNKIARQAVEWTRKQIHPSETPLGFLRPGERKKRMEYWRFLASLKPIRAVGDLVFVHDTPLAPGSDKYVRTMEDAREVFRRFPKVKGFFIGHSHVPMIFTEKTKFRPVPEVKYSFDTRVIVNVGSVGQPRDKDPRASYVILDDGFRFFRVRYDIEEARKRIVSAGLHKLLAERLSKGV